MRVFCQLRRLYGWFGNVFYEAFLEPYPVNINVTRGRFYELVYRFTALFYHGQECFIRPAEENLKYESGYVSVLFLVKFAKDPVHGAFVFRHFRNLIYALLPSLRCRRPDKFFLVFRFQVIVDVELSYRVFRFPYSGDDPVSLYAAIPAAERLLRLLDYRHERFGDDFVLALLTEVSRGDYLLQVIHRGSKITVMYVPAQLVTVLKGYHLEEHRFDLFPVRLVRDFVFLFQPCYLVCRVDREFLLCFISLCSARFVTPRPGSRPSLRFLVRTDYILTLFKVSTASGNSPLLPFGIVVEPYPVRVLAADYLILVFSNHHARAYFIPTLWCRGS